MTVNRTTLLDLPLPVTGTESGTWGDTTNNGLTQYMDIAVAGMNSLTSANFTAGALTLANTTGDSSATNIAAGSAQYGAIKVSSLATNSTITAPSSNRRYTIINADATYSVTIKASGQTGVTIVAGEKALVAFNGTDYVKIATANGTGEFTTVDTTNLEVTNIKAKDGTAAATIADSTGVVSITANPVLSGGTANGVLYLNGSKVATSGSALTFDGTNFATTGTITSGGSYNFNTTSGRDILWGTGSYTYITGNPGTGVMAFGIANSELMRLTSTGLGIGTSSPSNKLHVTVSAASTAAAAFYNTDTANGNGVYIKAGGSNSGKYALVIDNAASSSLLYLDSSGNLGLGVTPSAWYASGSGWKALQVGAFGILSNTATNDSRLMSNAYLNTGGSYIYLNSSQYATNYIQISGQHQWFTAPSGTAGNTITFSQVMTLDASGNLGVGTTSPAVKLHVSDATNPSIRVTDTTNPTSVDIQAVDGIGYVGTPTNHPLALFTNGTERARITSGGDLLVGTTSVPSSSSGGAAFVPSSVGRTLLKLGTTTTSGAGLVEFYNPNGMIGEISVNGSTTTYSTSSDYRLKNTIAPMTGALAKVALLKPCTYKWNVDGSDGEGFIAHELAEVVPQCVTGEKDGVDAEGKPVYQGVDTSFLVATLTAAIQEQQALITSLTARVALLEGN